MMTINADAQIPAARALNLAVARYERLASLPRWMQFPLVSDFEGAIRAAQRARAVGNVRHADELADLVEREWERRHLAANWSGRSTAAWSALVARLDGAIDWCRRVGVRVPAGIVDRLADARGHLRHAVMLDRQLELN